MFRGKIEAWVLTSVHCVLTPLFYFFCTRLLLLLAHFSGSLYHPVAVSCVAFS